MFGWIRNEGKKANAIAAGAAGWDGGAAVRDGAARGAAAGRGGGVVALRGGAAPQSHGTAVPDAGACDACRGAQDRLRGKHARADQASDARLQDVSAEQLERTFQDFFRMGAAVAIGELYDEGMLGNKDKAAASVREYLVSFGIASFQQVRELGISGPYLEDFSRIFGSDVNVPPAA